MNVIVKVGFCTCLLLWAALGVVGQSRRQNLKKCVSSDQDTIIVGCTALIEAGKESTANLAGAYSRRGSAYILKGDYDPAIRDFDEAIRLNPSYAPAYTGRGEAYFLEGDRDRAMQDLNQAVRVDPKFTTAYVSRAVVYIDMADLDRAIQDCSDAIRLSPKFANAYYNRGNAFMGKGDFEDAIKDLNDAIRLNPKFSESYFNRGVAYFFESNLDAAVGDFEHVISAAPASSMAVYAALMLHIAAKRQGRDDARQLAPVVHAADLSKWPGPLLKFDLGQIAADEVMSSATNPVASTQKRQICEANYFVAEDALSRNQAILALQHFKAARDSCPKGNIGYAEAEAELKRLDAADASTK